MSDFEAALAEALTPVGLQGRDGVPVVSESAAHQAQELVPVLKAILDRDPDLILGLGWVRYNFPIPDDGLRRSWGFYRPEMRTQL